MVDVLRRAFIIAVASVALGSCDFMGVTPFPGFVDKTDISVDLGSRIDNIVNGASSVTYDLNVVTAPSQQPRVLLLVEPQSGAGSFNYTGQEIVMDQNLAVLGQARTASALDYFSKPYSYTHDGNIIMGYTVLTPQGQATSGTLSTATGLEGFAFATGFNVATDATYIFATPSGSYSSFDLSWRGYNQSNWGLFASGTLSIIPAAQRPSSSDPNFANLGYQLVGLTYNQSTTEITFVLSKPADGTVVTARQTLANATNPATNLLPASGNWDISLETDRPYLSADLAGLFLVRRDGWMDRYPWTQTGALSFTGSKTEIVGDRSLSRKYAFLETGSPTGPSYMYRFDPSSRILTRYRRWW